MKTKRLRRLVVSSIFILGLCFISIAGINPEGGENIPAVNGQSATLLPDGTWLLIGGEGPESRFQKIWDPNSGTETVLSSTLQHARSWHTATLLPDGLILIFGGIAPDGQLVKEAELFDPETQSFQSLDLSLTPRSRHTATLLTDGSVLVAGGLSAVGKVLNDAELWNFQTGSTIPLSGKFHAARHNHTATVLANGKVLLAGGLDTNGNALDNGELFDPSLKRFTPLSALQIQQIKSERQNPGVAASVPGDGAVDVPVDTFIAVRFSTPQRVETVNADTITLSGPKGIEQATIVPAESGMLGFIRPKSQLLPDGSYSVTLNGVVDKDGHLLPVYSFSFTTESLSLGPPLDSPALVPSSSESQAQNPMPDGYEWKGQWKDGKPHSPWQDLPSLKARTGETALAGQVLDLAGKPLANVALEIEYGSEEVAASTDETGRFLLRDITPGWHELIIDGRRARIARAESSALTGTVDHGLFEYRLDIQKGKTNVLPFTIWLPKIDTANAVKISSPTVSEVIVTTPYLPGFELHLAPGTVIYDYEWNRATEVSVTPIPQDRTPFPMPQGIMFPVYTTIQPGGAYVYGPKGARIIYPNKPGAAPGTRAQLWHYDPKEKGWYVYGHGTVTEDGRQIVPDPEVSFYSFTGAGANFPLPPIPPPAKAPAPGSNASGGDPVDLWTGLFVLEKTDLFIPDVMPISVTRTYRTEDTGARVFGIGSTHAYEMFMSGPGNFDCPFGDLLLPDGSQIHFVRISGIVGDCDDSVLEHTGTPSRFFKARISVVGGPWHLKLTDGTIYIFGHSNGRLEGIRDRHGNEVTITRDGGGKVTMVTSPNGRKIQFTYDAFNRIIQVMDDIGRSVFYTYTTANEVNTVKDPNGGITNYNYNAAHRMTSIIDARGITFLTNQYEASGRVFKQTQANGTTFQFTYTTDAFGKVIETIVTDPRGNKRRVTFNGSGYVLTDTQAFGTPQQQIITYERQAGTHLVLSETDAIGRKTAYTYNAFGQVTSITRLADTPNAVTTSFTYEPTFNQLATITDPLAHTITFGYTQGKLTSVKNHLNETTTITNNSAGQPITITDPLGNTTRFTYNSGNLVSITDPNGISVTRTFDAVGRLLSVIDGLSNATQYTYDVLNRLTNVADALNGVTTFTYDKNGNLLTVKDARLKTTTYTYNNMDRLATRKDPLLKTESYIYDENGNLEKFTDRKAQATNYLYDSLNRRTRATYADLSTTDFTYDNGNRLIQIADSISGTSTRAYDDLDRLTSETTPQGSVSYTYDNAGRRTTMTVSGQPTINYFYDNANRLTQITQGISAVGFGYDAAGRRTSLTLPNGILVEYTYDKGSRLKELKYKKAGVEFGNLLYLYDNAGNRTKMGGSFARTAMPNQSPPDRPNTYNAANQQITVGFFGNMTYDNNGNLISQTSGPTQHVTNYVWNARNQLIGINTPQDTFSFEYDALGRRVKKTISGNLTEFFYDGINPVQESSGASILANILTGLGVDEYLTRTDVVAGTTSHFLTDALGSTVALANDAGVVQTEYTYSPFATPVLTEVADTNSFQYTGRENDRTGLYYYRARYYNPFLQRFISEDPLGLRSSDLNLYAYAFNSPLNFNDPLGLDVFFVGIGGSAFISLSPQGTTRGVGGQVGVGLAYDTETNTIKFFGSSGSASPTDVSDKVAGFNIGAGPFAGQLKGRLSDFFGTSREETLTLGIVSISDIVTSGGKKGISIAGGGKGYGLSATAITTYTFPLFGR
jgi:RHS repeat-associated protein